ncbi:hypothetical protein GGS26DRAFT_305782 [Hypomontagnella submonticulosa]|nr:hypothetical protein GGS26DRAFT_305782 [Hypomontagnella submonticulosa]
MSSSSWPQSLLCCIAERSISLLNFWNSSSQSMNILSTFLSSSEILPSNFRSDVAASLPAFRVGSGSMRSSRVAWRDFRTSWPVMKRTIAGEMAIHLASSTYFSQLAAKMAYSSWVGFAHFLSSECLGYTGFTAVSRFATAASRHFIITSISSYRDCAASAMILQSSTTFRTQSRRLLNRSCHDCSECVFSIEFGAGDTMYRLGTGNSEIRVLEAPGEEAWVIRISYTYTSFWSIC